MNEARSNGERYASAVDSSDLKLREGGGDIDIVIAAGLVEDGLATTLYRLTVEFDAQRAPVDAARRWASLRVAYANRLREEARQEAARPDGSPDRVHALTDAADEAQKAALASLRTEFALALSSMTTLVESHNRLGDFALQLARRRGIDIAPEAVQNIVSRTLDAFLEPNCPHCDGRGFTGGGRHEHSGPQIICKPCRGTGSRRVDIGRSDVERRFASHLMMSMDAQMYEVQRAIGRNRRLVTAAKELIARAQA